MNVPPPYSPVDEYNYRQGNRASYYPSEHQQFANYPPDQPHTTHAQFDTLASPSTASYSDPGLQQQQQQPGERGLGGLIVGLGAAAMLNNAMNQSSTGVGGAGVSEDRLATLARYDTVLLIDDSASMSQGSRWREAGLAVSGLAEALVRYDTDGVDVYFMNSVEYLLNARSAAEVNALFERVRPVGPSTPTDVRVEELLNVYLGRLESDKANNLPPIKPLNLIVITDGEADDPDTLAYALIGFAERLDQGRFPLNQLGVQFIQIGNDKTASKALKYLDNELKSAGSARRDIVDTTPYKGTVTTDFIIKAVLGGINKKIDHER